MSAPRGKESENHAAQPSVAQRQKRQKAISLIYCDCGTLRSDSLSGYLADSRFYDLRLSCRPFSPDRSSSTIDGRYCGWLGFSFVPACCGSWRIRLRNFSLP